GRLERQDGTRQSFWQLSTAGGIQGEVRPHRDPQRRRRWTVAADGISGVGSPGDHQCDRGVGEISGGPHHCTSSTRRFFERPSSASFEAIGAYQPAPKESSRSAGIAYLVVSSRTIFAARRRLRSRLCSPLPWLSVCPTTWTRSCGWLLSSFAISCKVGIESARMTSLSVSKYKP